MKKIIVGSSVAFAAAFGLSACITVPPQEQSVEAPVEEAPVEETPQAEPEVVVSNTDGVFEYEITNTENQDSYVDYMDTTMYPDNDTFLVVDVSATNVSDAPSTAPDPWMLDHVVAIDSEGRQHVADDEPWTDSLDANPGASVSYSAVWDLPEGVEVEYVELSAPDSDGTVATLEVP